MGPIQHKILLADDDDPLRESLGELFTRFGFGILEAADGLAALELARKEDFSLSILDYHMPGLTGIEVLRALRRELPLRSGSGHRLGDRERVLPCIMLSAHADPEEQREALNEGAFRFLRKPFRVDHLYDSVRDLMQVFLPGSPVPRGEGLSFHLSFSLRRKAPGEDWDIQEGEVEGSLHRPGRESGSGLPAPLGALFPFPGLMPRWKKKAASDQEIEPPEDRDPGPS